jgi:hypothetical protein
MKKITTDNDENFDIALRITEALDSKPRGFRSAFGTKLGLTPQAVRGWVETGSISKNIWLL